jgi:hypothetical protein
MYLLVIVSHTPVNKKKLLVYPAEATDEKHIFYVVQEWWQIVKKETPNLKIAKTKSTGNWVVEWFV